MKYYILKYINLAVFFIFQINNLVFLSLIYYCIPRMFAINVK